MINISLTFIACWMVSSLLAQDNSIRIKTFNHKDLVALQGYDPVTYFLGERPKKGVQEINTEYKGLIYYFTSVETKKQFEASPKKYEPKYGGWCAYAMGKDGSKVRVDPDTFKIIDGELYLFYNFYFNNTLKDWNRNEAALIKQADTNWDSIYIKNKVNQ